MSYKSVTKKKTVSPVVLLILAVIILVLLSMIFYFIAGGLGKFQGFSGENTEDETSESPFIRTSGSTNDINDSSNSNNTGTSTTRTNSTNSTTTSTNNRTTDTQTDSTSDDDHLITVNDPENIPGDTDLPGNLETTVDTVTDSVNNIVPLPSLGILGN